MPQLKELKQVGVTAPVTRPEPVDAPPLAHALAESHPESEVLDFLSGRPAQAVIMSGLIRDNGFESPFNRGTFHACRDAEGRLEGVALVGHAVYVAADTSRSLKAFAQIAQRQQNAHMILGEESTVSRFWKHYAPAGQAPRVFSREMLFEQRWPVSAPEPVAGLRPATLDDLMLVMPVHAAMAYEESGVNPIDVDLHGFRMRCARRIEHGRVWVLVEDGDLLFKADIASETPECVYLEGVYVDPASRKKGLGLRCLAQLGRAMLERAKCVSALVNEQNIAAQALFNKAGYKLRGRYDTVFLERN
ncbi:MAG TPA: GNAT family N-acetyltransferase [Pyrinomonadaceae bacterium]